MICEAIRPRGSGILCSALCNIIPPFVSVQLFYIFYIRTHSPCKDCMDTNSSMDVEGEAPSFSADCLVSSSLYIPFLWTRNGQLGQLSRVVVLCRLLLLHFMIISPPLPIKNNMYWLVSIEITQFIVYLYYTKCNYQLNKNLLMRYTALIKLMQEGFVNQRDCSIIVKYYCYLQHLVHGGYRRNSITVLLWDRILSGYMRIQVSKCYHTGLKCCFTERYFNWCKSS